MKTYYNKKAESLHQFNAELSVFVVIFILSFIYFYII